MVASPERDDGTRSASRATTDSLMSLLRAMNGGSAETDRQSAGPRRSESIDSSLAETRALAAVAMLALAGGVVSDVLADRFWSHHALLSGWWRA